MTTSAPFSALPSVRGASGPGVCIPPRPGDETIKDIPMTVFPSPMASARICPVNDIDTTVIRVILTATAKVASVNLCWNAFGIFLGGN